MAVSSGQLGAAQRIIIQVDLLGDKAVVTGFQQMSAGATGFAAAQNRASASSARLTRHTWAQNQAMFTLRRTTFYTTMALGGLVATVGILGFRYQNTIQTIESAVGPFLQKTGENMKNVSNQLFLLGALTPATFQEVADTFRMMFIGLEGAGATAAGTIKTLKNMLDLLAAGGTLNARSMKSLANAIQDMGFQGVISGRIVQRLAFLGIPIKEVLQKELGVAGDELANIKDQGITAIQVMDAVDRFVSKSRFRGAAFRLQQETLVGAWTTFVDLLSAASAGASKGPFSFIQNTLKGVNLELSKLYTANKPVTITAIAEAFDKQLSPKTHIVINLFILFTTILKVIIGSFYIFFRIIQQILRPFAYLINLTGLSTNAMQLFGIAIGLAVVALSFLLVRMIASAVWLGITTAATVLATATDWLFAIGKFAVAAAIWAVNLAIGIYNVLTRTGIFITIAATVATWAMTAAVWAESFAFWALNAALAALSANPIVIIIAAIVLLTAGLVILYFKWKAFHDFVNRTYDWLKSHPFVALLIPIYGQLVYTVIMVQKLYNWLRKIYNLVRHPLKLVVDFPGDGGGWFGKVLNVWKYTTPVGPTIAAAKAVKAATAQEGGSIVRGGSVLVGEGGPEIVSLPAGAQVTPLTHGAGGPLGWTMPDQNIKVILRVDGKDLAEVVAKHRQNVQARR